MTYTPGETDDTWLHWRDCDCDWVTKSCEDLHTRHAVVPQRALTEFIARYAQPQESGNNA